MNGNLIVFNFVRRVGFFFAIRCNQGQTKLVVWTMDLISLHITLKKSLNET